MPGTAIGLAMRTPVVLVTAALTLAILLAAAFLIATETRGEDAATRHNVVTRQARDHS